MRRAAAAACLALLIASNALAQSPEPPIAPGFLTRYDFQLAINTISLDDERFTWDAHFGGSLDVVDYRFGRLSALGDYEPILGSELRPFDPNQAYYALEVATSYRIGATEVAAFFHHVSRHLSDRPKVFSIAWNVMGARVMRRFTVAGLTIDGRVELGGVTQRSFVDYSWTGNIDVLVRKPINRWVGVFAHGYGELFGVDASVSERSTQQGGRIEAGMRLNGRAGALEFFAGFEQRIDADPLEATPKHWGLVGFRIVR